MWQYEWFSIINFFRKQIIFIERNINFNLSFISYKSNNEIEKLRNCY